MSHYGSKSGLTGANSIPLGFRRTAGGEGGSKRQFSPEDGRPSMIKQPYADVGNLTMPTTYNDMKPSDNVTHKYQAAQAAANRVKLQRNISASGGNGQADLPRSESSSGREGRPRKKKSRWATEEDKTVVPGMPTTMPTNLTPQQEKAYIVQLQIEDITRKLKSGDLGIPFNPEDRSPSPEPIYNGEGKRMNTREYRTRKKLEEERHKLIQEMTDINPDYKPPADYKPLLQRVSERVAIPADINPNINFVGLLIGPRGNTLKKIEKESNCKIMIRGKGSVKEGKVVRKDNHPLPGEDEPLHALVSSNCIENVKKAVDEINEIIKQGIEQPEEENDLRKLQLMELAKLNGTLREDLMPRERAWLRPENQNVTNTMICHKCGGRGHLAQDCRSSGVVSNMEGGNNGGGVGSGANLAQVGNVDRAKMDSEYQSLMAELAGVSGSQPSNNGSNNNQQQQQPDNNKKPPGGGPMRGPRYGGPRGGFNNNMRPPWMGPRHGGPPYHGGPPHRGYGPRGSGFGPPPMMNHPHHHPHHNQQQGPPPPWMQQGPHGGPPHGGPHHGGPPPPPQQGFGQQQWGGGNQQGGYHDRDQQQQQYGGDNSSNNSYYDQYNQQPPPPPPSSAPSQPPPPPSDMSSQWGQQQWQQTDGSQQQSTGNSSGQDQMSGYGYGGGYGSMPPMPSGPGPVPPPPPSSQDGSGDYSSYGSSTGYNMPPVPPPPPPQ